MFMLTKLLTQLRAHCGREGMCNIVRASNEGEGVEGGQQENLSVEMQAGPRQPEAPYLLLCPWNVCSTSHSLTRCCFQQRGLQREQCVTETLWTVCMTEPR